jgi:hypothetical protein
VKALAAVVLLVAVGCKTDPPAASENQSAARPRSGKVDLSTPHPAPPGSAAPAPEPPTAPAATAPAERYREVDANKDGAISDEERTTARRRRAQAIHDKLDFNNDGKLTVDEIKKTGARRIDPESADTNHDGEISVDELDTLLSTRARGGLFGRGGSFGGITPRP